MDDIKKQLKNVSLYDVKAYVRKAQNVVYNYTEMEALVREATNNEPWGASSTLMQKIAAGTYNFREREEIIGMVFRRFTEKSANEWRQIYKALQLLEYLLKNGSERFVDDARANLSLITMLRSFHYIDSQGRDQGINVRTKAKNLVELLNNDSALRAERKKSRDNAKKFQGVAGGIGSNSHGDENYEEYGTYEGRIFGDGGVYGQRFEENRGAGNNDFQEYEVEANHNTNGKRVTSTSSASASKPVPPKPEVDLFSFGEPTTSSSATQTNAATTAATTANGDDFDDFGDFQSSNVQASKPQVTNTLASLYAQGQPQQQQQHPQQQQQQQDLFGDFTSFQQAPVTPQYNIPISNAPLTGGSVSQAPKQDAFSSLFQTATLKAHGSTSTSSKPAIQQPTSTPVQAQQQSKPQTTQSNGEIDLLDL